MFEETDPLVGVFLGRDVDWQTDARCAGTDADVFFPDRGESTRDGKRICRGCTVRAECLEYALDLRERFGIWGGVSERERRQLLRSLDPDDGPDPEEEIAA